MGTEHLTLPYPVSTALLDILKTEYLQSISVNNRSN